MPLKCHFCCSETCAHTHPHTVFLKQRPALKSSTIFDIQRLWMSQRPQLLKLLTSERDGVVWQCYWWMLLLRVVFSPKCIGFACFFCCKRQIRKSEKQNQTFPPCPFSCHVLSGNSKQYWCRLVLVGKGSSIQKCWLLVLTSFSCRGWFQSTTLPVSSVVWAVELVIVGRDV